MLTKNKPIHAAIARLPSALRVRMTAEGHTQIDVEGITGVPQPQISRALNGERKRLTEPMRRLCEYAGIREDDQPPDLSELSRLLSEVTAASPMAAECVRGVLQSLAPLAQAHQAPRRRAGR